MLGSIRRRVLIPVLLVLSIASFDLTSNAATFLAPELLQALAIHIPMDDRIISLDLRAPSF